MLIYCFLYDLACCGCVAVVINYEMIKDLILNQTVRANLALLVVAGLPFSGKSTVLKKLLNSSGKYNHMTTGCF